LFPNLQLSINHLKFKFRYFSERLVKINSLKKCGNYLNSMLLQETMNGEITEELFPNVERRLTYLLTYLLTYSMEQSPS